MSSIEVIWNDAEWLNQARLLIKGLTKFSLYSRIGLIIRHSKRNEPSILDEDQNMELTEEGKQIARLFGSYLPKSKNLIIFHSGVNRCLETAEQIHQGFLESGGSSLLKGECNLLRGIGLDPNLFMEELKKYSLVDVVIRWTAGLYPENSWPTFTSYCKRSASVIWTYLENLNQNTLVIFITHDLHSIILRYGWFGFPLDIRGIDYLGGFAFAFESNMLKVLDYGMIKTTEIPFYYKKE
ncbi:MAG: histidine phosphatase family protein [Candidatus Thorarchaeota archaeon]